MAVALVCYDLTHYLGDLQFQFVDELQRVVFVGLYVTQLLLPDASQLGALQQFFVDEVYEFNAVVVATRRLRSLRM